MSISFQNVFSNCLGNAQPTSPMRYSPIRFGLVTDVAFSANTRSITQTAVIGARTLMLDNYITIRGSTQNTPPLVIYCTSVIYTNLRHYDRQHPIEVKPCERIISHTRQFVPFEIRCSVPRRPFSGKTRQTFQERFVDAWLLFNACSEHPQMRTTHFVSLRPGDALSFPVSGAVRFVRRIGAGYT